MNNFAFLQFEAGFHPEGGTPARAAHSAAQLPSAHPLRQVAALALLTIILTACATPTPTFTPQTVHIVGRVQHHPEDIEYGWPGVYFEGRFRGTAIGLKFDDTVSHFNVEIDGRLHQVLAPPGKATVWVRGLSAGEHSIRLTKRNETAFASGRFLGFEAQPGEQLLPAPPPRPRQMVFMGDSLTVGYGNSSGKRECTEAELAASTDATRSFAALTARHFDADHHSNAYSGLGLVRNFGDAFPGSNHRTYAHRTLPHNPAQVWVKPSDWNPQVLVLTLGGPDFAALETSPRWTADTLVPAFMSAYLELLTTLRAQYGAQALILLGVPEDGTGQLMRQVREEVARHRQAGHSRIDHFSIDMRALELHGCHWHASLRDHERIAQQLITVLERWQAQLAWR